MTARTRGVLLVAVGVLAAIGTAVALGSQSTTGFKTSQPAMLMQADRTDVEITPILTVGDMLASGYRFESVPDGISLDKRRNRQVDVYVNHETSTVAFPYVAAAPTAANSQNDFDNSQVSLLTLDERTLEVLAGELAIQSDENFQRFCSNYLATNKEGFSRPTLFTNEEAQDWVFRSGTAWTSPIPAGTAGAEQTRLFVSSD